MGVTIKLKGKQDSNEYKDAIVLKEIFEEEFRKSSSTNGEILILSNVTLFGQETKDVDIIVIGKFDRFSMNIKTKSKTFQNGREILYPQENRNLFINDFCFVIETKLHSADKIKLEGTTLLVRYNDKLHDVTTQSENQKYSLKNYFEDRLNFSPYICNFIWLRNISADTIKKDFLSSNPNLYDKHNYLPNELNLKWLFQLACVQSTPYNPIDKDTNQPKGYCTFKSLKYNQSYDFNEMDRIFDLFSKVKESMGDLNRRKLEQITKKILKEQIYAQAIGEKLVLISGRAGTGKTIKLINIACDLAENGGARCLILTYNHALVSDIKRMLALGEIPDDIDSRSVNISTLHKFFYEILLGFEIQTEKSNKGNVYIPNYLNRYYDLLNEFYEYVKNKLIGHSDLEKLMKTRHQQIAWDYVLIDEGQDWNEIEKKIIFFIFERQKFIVADGVDQLIRSQRKCNWIEGLRKDIDFVKTNEKIGLRQKIVLVNFVNDIAAKLNTNWNLKAKEDYYGGKIIVKIGDYTEELHKREFEACKANLNSAYDMMFLCPPNLVYKGNQEGKEERSFIKTDDFKRKGISIWDGTKQDLRTNYPVDINQHRLLQYESCRGLEGWTVVCLELDEFMKYKFNTYKEEINQEELALESFEEKRERFVNLWTLIPLTRAIDTLIITIKDKNTQIAKILREIYLKNPDNIEWIE